MTLSIQQQSEASTEEWQAAWNGSAHATFFQSPEWAQVWQTYSRGRVQPAAKSFVFSDGQRAVLPLCFEPKLGGLLNRYVASPEATYGGWLSQQPLSTAHAVLLTRWLLAPDGKNLVWRLNPYDPMALEAAMICNISGRRDVTHSVRLNADAETLFKGFKKGCREDIRKAQKRGNITVTPATTVEEWKAYYRVYQDSLRRWGHGPNDGYKWELFDTLRRRDSSNIRLWIARYDGQVVSGELSFYSRHQSVSWHAATLRDYLRSGVSKYQSYEILKDCCARGFDWLDFNPSAGLDGVKELKESFRAEAMPAPLVYVDNGLKRVIRRCATAFDVRDAKIVVEPLNTIIPASEISPVSVSPSSIPSPTLAADSERAGAGRSP